MAIGGFRTESNYMSKIVKNMLISDLKSRFDGVSDALIVNVAGMDSLANYTLRKELRSKNIKLLMVKNSLARRATEGSPLSVAFEQAEGSLAVVWGADDIVALAKIVTKLTEDKKLAPFEARGGVMDGARLTKEQVKDVSKWPSREEQLSILLGQIVGVGGRLASQLTSVGGALASQIKQKGEGEEAGGEAPAADEAPVTT